MPKMNHRPNIKDTGETDLLAWLNTHDIAAYRLDQIYKWVYQHQVDSFSEMTNISKNIRRLLEDNFRLERLHLAQVKESTDGTRKYLLQLADGHYIESVLIPEDGHDTLCISTQVGCAQGCRFCLTAQKGFIRNLTPAEILSQILDIQKNVGATRRISNVVLMGMGEPLANYERVLTALAVMTNGDWGMKFSTRKVTLSTVGLVPQINQLGHRTTVNLAVSLNATTNEVRNRLMPINRKYPIEKLLASCAAYPMAKRRKITYEYILIKGINDTEEDARRLLRLLSSTKAKINLIPFNEHDGCDFERPALTTINDFRQILHDRHFTVITRLSKGADISAACGQLSAEIQNY